MAVIDKKTYAVAKRYTDTEVAGGGAIKGKNCTIDSIDPITGGARVTFKWTLDNGTVQTGTMDVMDGADGQDGQQGPQGIQGPAGPAGADGADGLGIKSVDIDGNNHLIITYDDNTTHDAGEIPGGGGDVISVNDKKGVVKLYATDINMSDDPSAKTIALSISELQGSFAGLSAALADKVDKEAGKGLSTNDYTMEDMQKLAALLGIKSAGSGLNFDSTTGELTATGAAITIDSQLDETSPNAIQNQAVAIPIHALQGSMSNKADKSDTYTKTQVDNALTAKLDANKVGAANGAAPLGSDSKVPAANLPSYVDDVEEYASKSAFPVTGESGKIYVDLSDNKTYRWSGTDYVVIGNDLALGETNSTAYPGNKGKENADNITQIQLDITYLQGSMSGKADKSDTYTKTQVDTALAAKANTSALDAWAGTSTADSNGDITFDNLDDTKNYDVPYFQNKFVKITGMTKGTGTDPGTIKLTYHTDATNGTSGKLREIK